MANKPDCIVVHCSDSPYGDAELIRQWHEARGFSGIGYHAVITNGYPWDSRHYYAHFDGQIQPGRRPWTNGAHCLGYNQRSLGVCLIGRGEYTINQLWVLRKLVRSWQQEFGVDVNQVVGHYELDGRKTCPNISGKSMRHYLAGEITLTNFIREIAEWNEQLKNK